MKAKSVAAKIAQARKAWEMSVEELAERAGVKPSVVRTAETWGRIDAASLKALSEALGGTLEDLIDGRPFWNAPALALKSARPAARSEMRQALVRAAVASRVLKSLRLLLEIDDPWNTIGSALGPRAVEGDPAEHAETLAAMVRERLGLGEEPIASVRSVMTRIGVASFFTRFPDESVDGATWRNRGEAPFVAVNALARGGLVTAIRATLAHELCHVLFDRPEAKPSGWIETRHESDESKERRANAFAAYLLAPREAVSRLLASFGLRPEEKPTAQHLLAVSSHFGMGVESTAWHLVSCGYWRREDVLRNRGLVSSHFASVDDRELRPTTAENAIPLERRGEILDLATQALEQERISVARWRELVGLSAMTSWPALLQERRVALDADYHRALSN